MSFKMPTHNIRKDSMTKYQKAFENAGSDSLNAPMEKDANYDWAGRGNTSFTVPHYFDPRLNNPMGNNRGLLNLQENDNQRKILNEWLRIFYNTHPVVGSIIDMYSRYPMSGCELVHSDKSVRNFFEELFFDELDYESLFIDIGKEFWTIGEVGVLGVWDDDLKVWTYDDLLDPSMIKVERAPFGISENFSLEPDEEMKKMVNDGSQTSTMFRNEYPDLWKIISAGGDIPLSEDRFFWTARKSKRSDLRGTPILLRALRTLRLEERMTSAMQATAERMYAPMIIFKLGMKMDDGKPFLPTPAMISQFKNNFNNALNSDFRAIFTHFMVEEKELFNNVRMNNWKQDWDMLDEKLYMCFGMSADMIKASNSQTYASTALRFDLISQFMKTHQRTLINFYNQRARMVALANEFYETDESGNVIEETYIEYDEEGNRQEVKRPKPSFPELKMKVINFKDDEKQRDFLVNLRKNDIPVSGQDLAVGVDIDLSESAEKLKDEKIKNAVMEAQTQKSILEATAGKGLPIPPDTKTFFKNGVMPKRYEDWFNGEIVEVGDIEEEKSNLEDEEETSLLDGVNTESQEETEHEIEKVTPDVSNERREEMPKE